MFPRRQYRMRGASDIQEDKTAEEYARRLAQLTDRRAADAAAGATRDEYGGSMTPEEEAYAERMRTQNTAITQGDSERLKEVDAARTANPEIAATIDQYGSLTDYGLKKAGMVVDDVGAVARKVPTWAWVVGGGAVLYFLLRHTDSEPRNQYRSHG